MGNKTNNFENIKSMDYKELAEFLADWFNKDSSWHEDWEQVHDWLTRECLPEDKATHNIINGLVYELRRLISIHTFNFFDGKIITVTDPENWNGYRRILVTVGNISDDDESYDTEVNLCVRELLDKPILRTGNANVYTQIRFAIKVHPYVAIQSNWDWAKKLFNEIPDEVSYEWFVLHGYMPIR